MPDPNTEHGLRVQLATALKERDEQKARADAAEASLIKFRDDLIGHVNEKLEARAALVAARRECEVMRAALTTIRDGLNKPWLMGSEVHRVAVDCANAVLEADAALAAPAGGSSDSVTDALFNALARSK